METLKRLWTSGTETFDNFHPIFIIFVDKKGRKHRKKHPFSVETTLTRPGEKRYGNACVYVGLSLLVKSWSVTTQMKHMLLPWRFVVVVVVAAAAAAATAAASIFSQTSNFEFTIGLDKSSRR